MTKLTDEDIIAKIDTHKKMKSKESDDDLDFSINSSKVNPEVSNKLLRGVNIVVAFTMTAPLCTSIKNAKNIVENYLPSCVSFPIEHIYKRDYDCNTFTNNSEFIYLSLLRKGCFKPGIWECKDNVLKLRSHYAANFLKLDKDTDIKADIFGCLDKIRKTFLDYMSKYFNPYNVPDEVRKCIDVSNNEGHQCKFNTEITLECILNDYLD